VGSTAIPGQVAHQTWRSDLVGFVLQRPPASWPLRIAAASTGGFLGVAFGLLLAGREFLALLTAILVAAAIAGAIRVTVPESVRGRFSVAIALAFSLHLAVLVVLDLALVSIGRGGFVTGDDSAYAGAAWRIARTIRGEATGFQLGTGGFLLGTFSYAEGFLFSIVGYQVLVAKTLILGMALVLAVVIFDIAYRIFDDVSGLIAGILVAFYPSLVMWSSLNLKDPLAWLLVGLVLWGIVRFQLRPRAVLLALVLLLLLPMYDLRITMYPGLALAILLGFVASPRLFPPPALRVFVIGLVVIGIAWTGYAAFRTGLAASALARMEYQRQAMPIGARTGFGETIPIIVKTGDTFLVQEAGLFPWVATLDPASRAIEPKRVVRVLPDSRVADAGWNPEGTTTTEEVVRLSAGDLVVVGGPTTEAAPPPRWIALNLPVGTQVRLSDGQETAQETYDRILAYLPTGVAYALFAPVPWSITRGHDLLTAPEMLIWYVLLATAVVTLVRFRARWWLMLPLVLFVAAFTAAMALTEGNVGTAYRHRAMIIPFVIVLAAPSLLWLGRCALSAVRRAR
jgi:hypothetical protein